MADDNSKLRPRPLDYSPPEPTQSVGSVTRVVFWTFLAIGLIIAIYAVFLPIQAARVNVWVVACWFIVISFVVRFRHVRF